MKTIKIIDLLNKIANGEEVPEKIKYRDWLYEFDNSCKDYLCQYDSLLYRDNDNTKDFLNDEVEIIEEKKEMCHKCGKYPAEYNQTYCEYCLGISKEDNFTGMKFFSNGKEFMSFDTSGEVKCRDDVEIEEDNKIEKLNLDTDELLKNVIITAPDYIIEGKINELIDEVNKLKENK